MTLQSSGMISLSDISREFGGTGQVALSKYYSGNGIVPPGTIGYPNGVPTIIPTVGGTIRLSNFYGAGNLSVSVTTPTITVVEGGNITFTITSSVTGILLYWTIISINGSVTAGDFTNNTLSGQVMMVSNSALVTLGAALDHITEGDETFVIQVHTGSTTGPIVATSPLVKISDTTSQIEFKADYVVLTYQFTNGIDLDTRTRMISPTLGGIGVGWAKDLTQVLPNGQLALTWGGDNTGIGVETVLVDIAAYRANFSTPFTISCGCFWYGTMGSAPVRIFATFYKGGTMVPGQFTFTNSTATSSLEVAGGFVQVTLTTQDGNTAGQPVAQFTYDPVTGAGTFTTT